MKHRARQSRGSRGQQRSQGPVCHAQESEYFLLGIGEEFLREPVFCFAYLLIFGCAGSPLLRAGFLWLQQTGATLHCNVRASPYSGVSSCRAWALQHGLKGRGAPAQLPCGMWHLPRPGIQPVSPALAGGFLNHWPTREIPEESEFYLSVRGDPQEAPGFSRLYVWSWACRASSGCLWPKFRELFPLPRHMEDDKTPLFSHAPDGSITQFPLSAEQLTSIQIQNPQCDNRAVSCRMTYRGARKYTCKGVHRSVPGRNLERTRRSCLNKSQSRQAMGRSAAAQE